MPRVIARHDEILAQAIRGRGGRVLTERGEGDSFFAVFSRATDAVLAARDIQLALHAERWPDGIEIRVRMAIDTGETAGDYRGPIANRSARIRALAQGGQVLISQSTHGLVRDQLPDDLTLKDLGLLQLRDVVSPEHVFEVVAIGLPRPWAPAPPRRILLAELTRPRRTALAGAPLLALLVAVVIIFTSAHAAPPHAEGQTRPSTSPITVPPADYKIYTVADGAATAEVLAHPEGLAVDQHDDLFIADTGNNRVLELEQNGALIDAVGGGNQTDASGQPGNEIRLSNPTGLSFDDAGNLYIADTGDNRVLEVHPDLTVYSVAGSGKVGKTPRNGEAALTAPLNGPSAAADTGINPAVSSLGYGSEAPILIVLDAGNAEVTAVDQGLLRPVLAPQGNPAYSSWPPWAIGAGGLPSIAAQSGFRFFVSASSLSTVEEVTPSQLVSYGSPLGAGTTRVAGTGVPGYAGDGQKGTRADLRSPEGLAVDASRNRLYIADTGNDVVRAVDLFDDVITTIAGTGEPGYSGDNLRAGNALLDAPAAVAVDSKGDIFIADTGNNVVREMKAPP